MLLLIVFCVLGYVAVSMIQAVAGVTKKQGGSTWPYAIAILLGLCAVFFVIAIIASVIT